ncbi:hypothetical protein [Bacillus sp. PS06]|uniref:hypothetical protein n=1 Tax=Bacillus sp. PS06 TaxID=2764176 RepID=UPI001785D760|nr:hypothetical protein [Bacillus sp. PS06]MBD8069859.1 hypothetical protein [Bacillus sp. PS06]
MKIWNITEDRNENEIQVGKVTILKGSNSCWYKLARDIDDYFNNKKSKISIFEDTQLLYQKDWECLFIPFDAHVQLDKITSKSPLKILVDDIVSEIAMSPIYHEFIDAWQSLSEEIDFFQSNLTKYELGIRLVDFELDHFKSFISLQSLNNLLKPIQFKKLLLSLLANKMIEKKTLVILEYPELYADQEEISELRISIEQLVKKGVNFIIITNSSLTDNCNYVFGGKILNAASILKIKRKVMQELPFYCDDELYNQALNILLQYVDNLSMKDENLKFSTDINQQLKTILFVLTKHLEINLNLDLTGLPDNIKAYIKSYF